MEDQAPEVDEPKPKRKLGRQGRCEVQAEIKRQEKIKAPKQYRLMGYPYLVRIKAGAPVLRPDKPTGSASALGLGDGKRYRFDPKAKWGTASSHRSVAATGQCFSPISSNHRSVPHAKQTVQRRRLLAPS